MPALAAAGAAPAGTGAGASATGAGAVLRSGLDGSGGRRGARLVLRELGLQLIVLGDGLAPLDDDLIEEVIDLVRVEAFLEPDVLKLLGDDVIGG